LAKNIQQIEDVKDIVIDPVISKKILYEVMAKCDDMVAKGMPPVLVVSPPIRLPIRRFAEKYISHINVISHNEIADNVKLESVGSVTTD
jgi:flagellar biosynthesis protein FlhA